MCKAHAIGCRWGRPKSQCGVQYEQSTFLFLLHTSAAVSLLDGCGLFFLEGKQHLCPLLLYPLGTAVAGLANLLPPGLRLVVELFGPGLLSLLLVDVLHEDTLVLENVALGLQVQVVVQVLVDLLSLAVLLEQPPEDTHPADPDDLAGHTGIGRTFPLARASVPTLAPSFLVLANAGTRVHRHRLADDQTILNELPNVLARV